MKIAIGFPVAIPGTPGRRLVEWARRAERAGFSSLGSIGRIVYDSHEELVALAAAAGATERIGLATTVLIAPPREPVLLAKQAATLDAVSGGRLTLGIGVGWRDDDFRATGARFQERGRTIETQIAMLRRIFAGHPPGPGLGPVGPRPVRGGGPELLLGGDGDAPLRRAGTLGDAYIATPQPPSEMAKKFAVVSAAWKEAGRPGAPRFVASRYFALGDAQERATQNMADYYRFGGDAFVQGAVGGMLRTRAAVREAIDAVAATGTDELFFWPTLGDLDQIELLAEAVA